MGNSRSWNQIRIRFDQRRHTTLLVAIIGLIVVRAVLGDSVAAPLLFSFAMLAVVLVALYTIQVDELVGDREALLVERRRRTIAGWTLAIAATFERVMVWIAPSHTLYVTGAFCYLIFFAYITFQLLRGVLRQRDITRETISMSISVYLLMGLTWGFLFALIYDRHPQAFSFAGSTTPLSERTIFPTLTYFSFTTLSTIGYGDIAPVMMQARYAAVAEGITGQFYLAILVARLVGIYMSQSESREKQKLEAEARVRQNRDRS
jgi:voltage-gated potassium channel